MFAYILLVASLLGASAFSPAGIYLYSPCQNILYYLTFYQYYHIGRVASSSMRMEFAGGLPGAAGPELKTFDPLNFSSKSPEWVPWFREAELKHGRIAMLATAGWIAADLSPLPGDVHQVSSLNAHAAAVESGAMIQVLLW